MQAKHAFCFSVSSMFCFYLLSFCWAVVWFSCERMKYCVSLTVCSKKVYLFFVLSPTNRADLHTAWLLKRIFSFIHLLPLFHHAHMVPIYSSRLAVRCNGLALAGLLHGCLNRFNKIMFCHESYAKRNRIHLQSKSLSKPFINIEPFYYFAITTTDFDLFSNLWNVIGWPQYSCTQFWSDISM